MYVLRRFAPCPCSPGSSAVSAARAAVRERRSDDLHARLSRVAAEARGRRLPEERLAERDGIARRRGRRRASRARCPAVSPRSRESGRGGQLLLSMFETHVEERDDVADLLVRQVRVRHQPAVLLLGIEPRRDP